MKGHPLRRWAVVIDYELPYEKRVIDSYHLTEEGAKVRCRQALRPLALLTEPKIATIRIVPIKQLEGELH